MTDKPAEQRAHELKCWPEYFWPLIRGDKTFEIRKDDRGFGVGDLLHLREWQPDTAMYTGRDCWRVVTYRTTFMQRGAYVALGIAALRQPEAQASSEFAEPSTLNQWRDFRACPECGAAKGYACRKPSCPQLQTATPGISCVWRSGCKTPDACVPAGHCCDPRRADYGDDRPAEPDRRVAQRRVPHDIAQHNLRRRIADRRRPVDERPAEREIERLRDQMEHVELGIARMSEQQRENERMRAALQRVAAWDFDIRVDCVADAQALARAALGARP